MARRRLLNAEAWNRLLMPPIEERDMVRHFTLSREDLALIRTRRTEPTQIGFALLLLYLRCPGRVLAAGETPPGSIITFVARQLGVRRSAFAGYGRRDETRRKHLAELMTAFGFRAFGDTTFGELVTWLTPAAQIDRRPGWLILLALDELRQRRILLPPPIVIERAIHQARNDGERISHRAVIDTLTIAQRQALDAHVPRRTESHITSFGWLRTAPQSPAGLIFLLQSRRPLLLPLGAGLIAKR
jgi:TnpA family transposase